MGTRANQEEKAAGVVEVEAEDVGDVGEAGQEESKGRGSHSAAEPRGMVVGPGLGVAGVRGGVIPALATVVGEGEVRVEDEVDDVTRALYIGTC